MRTSTIVCALVIALMVPTRSSADSLPIVPLPRQVQLLGGNYTLRPWFTVTADDDAGKPVAAMLDTYLQSIITPSSQTIGSRVTSAIHLLDAAQDAQLGDEGYRLTVDGSGISIAANTAAGLFYGVQTLEQLLPDKPTSQVDLPYVRIVDWPEYRWRGIHLDVSRHFFPVSTVEQYIDLAARYKLNVFHWHLTDDQGWRIQLEKYPLLTQIGGCRNGTQVGGEGSTDTDGKLYCGYYTQDQIREVVAYASARFITVVPEIDMPGHSDAAIASYPWLGCMKQQIAVRELWGESTHAMCPTEKTFQFIDDEIGELATLFPGPYIHIGGDEVLTDDWEASPFVASLMKREHLASYQAVQGYFTHRVEAIVAKHGKRVVGWDDILPGGVSPGTTIVAWNHLDSAVTAAKQGVDAVINPDGPLYFDADQGNQDYEPLSIGGLTTLQMVYDFDPARPGLTPDQAKHIIGAQGDVWAEYIPTSDHLFYMLLPRELALAELCWTPRSEMNWFDFLGRIDPQLSRLEDDGYHYRIPDVTFDINGSFVTFPEQQPTQNDTDISVAGPGVIVYLSDMASDASIHYTLDGSKPTAASPVYGGELRVPAAGRVTLLSAIAELPDGRTSAPSFLRITHGPPFLSGAGRRH